MSNKQEEHMDREETYDRPLPHNDEAERVVLGAMLMDPDAFDEATNVVDAKDFFRVTHQHLFKTMVDVFPLIDEQGDDDLDILGIMKNELESRAFKRLLIEGDGDLDILGLMEWGAEIKTLIEALPHTIDVTHHARIVKEKSIMRELIHSADRILSAAYVDLNEKESEQH